ncbi:hypothetical protein D3C85_1216360 [compost metagenome]
MRVRPIDAPDFVGARRDIDDPPLRSADDGFQQKLGQQEVAEMVDTDHGLEAICCGLPLHGDDARVVQEHIQHVVLGQKRRCKSPDARQRTEIAQHQLDVCGAALAASFRERLLAALPAAAEHDDGGAFLSQRHRRGKAHA